MEWPPQSPDLSPIENAWAIVQAKVDAAGCKDFQEFQETVLREWKGLPMSTMKYLMSSLRSRVHECLELQGQKTHY